MTDITGSSPGYLPVLRVRSVVDPVLRVRQAVRQVEPAAPGFLQITTVCRLQLARQRNLWYTSLVPSAVIC